MKAVCWVNTGLRLVERDEGQGKLGPCVGEEGKTSHAVRHLKRGGTEGGRHCQISRWSSVSYRMASQHNNGRSAGCDKEPGLQLKTSHTKILFKSQEPRRRWRLAFVLCAYCGADLLKRQSALPAVTAAQTLQLQLRLQRVEHTVESGALVPFMLRSRELAIAPKMHCYYYSFSGWALWTDKAGIYKHITMSGPPAAYS